MRRTRKGNKRRAPLTRNGRWLRRILQSAETEHRKVITSALWRAEGFNSTCIYPLHCNASGHVEWGWDMQHSRFPHLVRREKEVLCNPSRRPLEGQTKLARTVALFLGQAELWLGPFAPKVTCGPHSRVSLACAHWVERKEDDLRLKPPSKLSGLS
jgi:hypothetical protein